MLHDGVTPTLTEPAESSEDWLLSICLYAKIANDVTDLDRDDWRIIIGFTLLVFSGIIIRTVDVVPPNISNLPPPNLLLNILVGVGTIVLSIMGVILVLMPVVRKVMNSLVKRSERARRNDSPN